MISEEPADLSRLQFAATPVTGRIGTVRAARSRSSTSARTSTPFTEPSRGVAMSDTTLPAPGAGAEDPERRRLLVAAGAAGCVAAVAAVVPFVASLAPSERARSLGGPVEVDIGDVPPGGLKTVEWRGKPVWIQRRTPAMLAALEGHDAQLADPKSALDDLAAELRNDGRSLRPEVFVAVGICTHLGCSPTPVPLAEGASDEGVERHGGFYCPCHGSTFDLAGRVFRNKPAPTNLVIPPHAYLDDRRLRIGEPENT